MREANILFKDEPAGILTQHDDGSFTFSYLAAWMGNSSKPDISPTLPKNEQPFHATHLFPFFYNMLPEGSNRQVICKLNRIDKEDYFGLLMTTAQYDSIGAVRIIKSERK